MEYFFFFLLFHNFFSSVLVMNLWMKISFFDTCVSLFSFFFFYRIYFYVQISFRYINLADDELSGRTCTIPKVLCHEIFNWTQGTCTDFWMWMCVSEKTMQFVCVCLRLCTELIVGSQFCPTLYTKILQNTHTHRHYRSLSSESFLPIQCYIVPYFAMGKSFAMVISLSLS